MQKSCSKGWRPEAQSCMLGGDHCCPRSWEDTWVSVPCSASKEDHRPCLAWGLVLGLPAGTKTVVCVSREEARSWSERSPLQLQLFAQCRAHPGCTHMLPGPWLESKEPSFCTPRNSPAPNSRIKTSKMELPEPSPSTRTPA